ADDTQLTVVPHDENTPVVKNESRVGGDGIKPHQDVLGWRLAPVHPPNSDAGGKGASWTSFGTDVVDDVDLLRVCGERPSDARISPISGNLIARDMDVESRQQRIGPCLPIDAEKHPCPEGIEDDIIFNMDVRGRRGINRAIAIDHRDSVVIDLLEDVIVDEEA